jgi:4-hydroxythreonine-4-phosphate dehydrogenase
MTSESGPARRPVVAVTVGDPSGIGPEIALQSAADARVLSACQPVLYGPASASALADFPPGQVDPRSGRAAYDAVVQAVSDTLAKRADAIATAPVNNSAWGAAGQPWRGHTDLLAHLCGVTNVAMLFWSESLRVVLATVHIPLRDVPAALTPDRLRDVIGLTWRSLPSFGIGTPRLAVAGLNPHAGEAGVIGREDEETIAPVVHAARQQGIDIVGPVPADTVFTRAVRGEFDCVIACYHDQGLIPVKLVAFGKAVNVTIGLPIIRTSVDHGTAFDIARQGRADASSMIEAILLAAKLVDGQRAEGTGQR